MSFYAKYPLSGTPILEYATFSAFPPTANLGALALDLSTGNLFYFNGTSWIEIAGPSFSSLTVGAYDSHAGVANGLQIITDVLYAQSATASVPGMVNTGTQTFAGNKTFTGSIGASNLSGTNTGDVTIGTADGLSLAGQVLSLALSSTSTTGALSSTDWNTFNNKQAALSLTNLTDAGTDGIIITNGTGAVVGSSPVTISQQVADTTHNGYLSSTDWNTFNGKQAAGNYITALTGDVTATGPGSVAATLATVNGNVGSFGSSTSIPSFTVNAKGLITAASGNVVIAPAGTLTGTTLNATVVSSSLTSVGTITTGTWNGTTLDIAHGGTGQTTANAAFAALSPMTTLGDIIFENATPAPARLAGNTTTTKMMLSQTGNGTISAAPVWAALVSGDIPNNAANTTGTASNITASSNSTLTTLSALSLPASQLTGTLQAAQFPALTGDVTTTAGSLVTTLATVNGNVGSFGSSTSIPSFTVNAKGLITAASGNVVIAPAGTLSGTTLNATVVSSSLTSVGTITTGTWNGTTLDIAHGGTGQTTASAAFGALSPLTTKGDILAYSTVNTRLPVGTDGQVLSADSTQTTGLKWTAAATGTVTSVALTVPAFLSVSGSPITTSGTLAVTLSGTALPVANGGTGATTLTAHGVLIGEGTSAVTATSAGTSGQVLISQGASADPIFSATAGPTTGLKVVGTNTNDNAAAGNVGEMATANPGGNVTPGASGAYVTVTSVSLTAGDWDVEGTAQFAPGGTWAGTGWGISISTNATTQDNASLGGFFQTYAAAVTNSVNHFAPTGNRRISLGATTTIYLIGQATYTTLGTTVWGTNSYLRARRMR